jgi:hypothetical protein
LELDLLIFFLLHLFPLFLKYKRKIHFKKIKFKPTNLARHGILLYGLPFFLIEYCLTTFGVIDFELEILDFEAGGVNLTKIKRN